MMAWIAAPGERTMDAIMASQVGALREQMVSAPPEPEGDAAQMPGIGPMGRRHLMMRQFGARMPGTPGTPGQ
jgi:hypothetical protein